MAIHESRHQSDLEKRLRLLRQQMYGKGSEELRKTQNTSKSDSQTFRYSDAPIKSDSPSHSESFRSDITYLRADLFKIAIFSAFIFGAQAALYYLLKQNLLNINLF